MTISYYKFSILTSLLLVIGLMAINAQKLEKYAVSEEEFSFYKALNAEEKRLLDYKDSDEELYLKLQQLAHINKARKKYKAPEVKLDIYVSRVSNKISKQAIDGGFMGHYNLEGESPYLRNARWGGKHHVQENASSISSTANLPSSNSDILSFMQEANNAFMAERKPNDGHKQNCIDKKHNFVGLGFAIEGNEFRYYEEFVDNYLSFESFPTRVSINKSIVIPCKAKDGFYINMALAYYEKFPKAMSANKINAIPSYPDYTEKVSHKILPWEMPEVNEGEYTNLEFNFDKKGLYYIQVYLDTKPYKTGSPASTKGKIQASGIVIEVR